MEENSGQPKSGIKIVDRRRFDSEGIEKPDDKEPTLKVVPEQKTVPQDFVMQDTSVDEPALEETAEDGDISFSSFVISMATQALMLMGQMKAPDGMPVTTDPTAAKQTIDILTMLEAKTRGNLKAQEKQLINDALHNLKIAYLKFS